MGRPLEQRPNTQVARQVFAPRLVVGPRWIQSACRFIEIDREPNLLRNGLRCTLHAR